MATGLSTAKLDDALNISTTAKEVLWNRSCRSSSSFCDWSLDLSETSATAARVRKGAKCTISVEGAALWGVDCGSAMRLTSQGKN